MRGYRRSIGTFAVESAILTPWRMNWPCDPIERALGDTSLIEIRKLIREPSSRRYSGDSLRMGAEKFGGSKPAPVGSPCAMAIG